MEPDTKEADAIARRIEEQLNDMWSPFDSGRHAYHIGIPLTDNPWDEPPNVDVRAFLDWARGWHHEREKDA